MRFRIRLPFKLVLLGMIPAGIVAQDEAIVDALAPVLAAEDTRHFDESVLLIASEHSSHIVRRHAALAIGRIGDHDGTAILVRLTADPNDVVRLDAVFALGILGDDAALPRIREIAFDGHSGDCMEVCAEAMAAIARIGGPTSAAIITELLARSLGTATSGNVPDAINRALRESWRLAHLAPVELLAEFAESRERDTRAAAIYSLGRLRATNAANVMLRATEDEDPHIRGWAVRTLDATYADSSHISRTAVAARVEQLVVDRAPHVRIFAIRSLATFDAARYATLIAERAGDPDPNVRVEALAALGQLEGPDVADALKRQLTGGLFATRREALISLATVQGAASLPAIQEWVTSGQWRERFIAVQALGNIGIAGVPTLRTLAIDPDPRVGAAALSRLFGMGSVGADTLVDRYWNHGDVGIRAAVFRHVRRNPSLVRPDQLLAAYRQATRDAISSARVAVITALAAVDASFPESRVAQRFLGEFPRVADPQVLQIAIERIPAARELWSSWRTVQTTWTMADYRVMARELLLPAELGEISPSIEIVTGRGNIEIELFAADAPQTVRAFLDLADQRYFDGHAWHRVVPGFVIQDGDSRGDGTGGPGYTLRDEVSRHSYVRGTVGLARSGPDTGGSQFFVTLGPQPHLDGAYTVFGRVISGWDTVDRITYGDIVRRLRRKQ